MDHLQTVGHPIPIICAGYIREVTIPYTLKKYKYSETKFTHYSICMVCQEEGLPSEAFVFLILPCPYSVIK